MPNVLDKADPNFAWLRLSRDLHMHPNDAETPVNLSHTQLEIGHLADGVAALRGALVTEPEHPAALTTLALYANRTGDEAAARDWLALNAAFGIGSSALPLATTMAAAATAVGAFPLAVGSKDAAVLLTLPPGAYTMPVLDGGGTGIALAEIYDATVAPTPVAQRLINISSRGLVGAGENALIGGFVVTGNAPKRLLVRGAGPALAAFGVTGVLADPTLKVFDAKGQILAQNDNWETPSAVQAGQSVADLTAGSIAAGAFGFAGGSKDAALIGTLAPGAYSAQLTGTNGTTGAALVEVYELP